MSSERPFDPLEDFFKSTQELLFTTDRDGAIVRMSAPLARLLGPLADEGRKLADRVHPDDQGAFTAAWSRLGESGEPARLRCRLAGADGAYRAWECLAQRGGAGGEIHGSLRDGDQKAKAEILHLIEQNAPVIVWAVDQNGFFTHYAGKATAATGLAEGQLVGLNVSDVYRGHEVLPPVQRAMAGEFTHVVTQVYDHFWENWHIPVRDARSEVTAVVGITLDVTDARRAERALLDKIALIERQQQVINALSTPIIEVWEKVLTLPLVGVVDSARAAVAMEDLLAQVAKRGARFAILDLTGIEAVDSSTANHLLKLIQALRLLGAEGIITGIQPSVAQTMVTLGLHLDKIVTLANLRQALQYCMTQLQEGASR